MKIDDGVLEKICGGKRMDKEWYKSKTVWTAGIGFILALLGVLGVVIPVEVYALLGSIGLYSVRDAIK